MAAIALVQAGDSGATAIASGSPATVLPVNATPGNTVIVVMTVPAGYYPSVPTSSMGTFTEIVNEGNGVSPNLFIYACTVTGAGRTVTWSSIGQPYYAQATEWSGTIASVASAGYTTVTSTGPGLDFIAASTGSVVIVAVASQVALTSGPGYTDYDTGGFTFAKNQDVAWYIAPTTGTFSFTWTTVSSATWGTCGVVLVSPIPSAPTLVSPANASYQDVASGLTFSGIDNTLYNAQGAYAMRIKVSGGSYQYWNATTGALQSGIVWNTDSVPVGGTFGPTLPNTAISDGHTYNWSLASQDSSSGQQGPFATDSTFFAQAPPVLSVTALASIISTPIPIIRWTETLAAGTSQVNYRVVYYTAAQATIAGFAPGISPSTYDTGTVTSGSLSFATPSGAQLANGSEYVIYVQINETGPQPSAWESTSTTIIFDGPAPPTLAVTAGNDSVTNAPFVFGSALFNFNQVTEVDSSFETGVGSAIAITNCWPVAVVTIRALDGLQSLRIESMAAGAIVAGLGTGLAAYLVVPGGAYSAISWIQAYTAARACTLIIAWYQAGGAASAVKATSSGTAETDSTTGWTLITCSDHAPSDAAYAQIRWSVAATGAANEIHFVDDVGLFSGLIPPPWTLGGFYDDDNVTAEFQGSDDGGVTWFDLRFGATATINDAQTATCLDYESPPVLEAPG
jgi:hypothetical protein